MIQVVAKEILNDFITDYEDRLVEKHIIKADTLDACFRRVYALKRSARYDNARRYDFETEELEHQFLKWEEENETMEMYYGSATVD